MHQKEIITAGVNIQDAKKALIMIHGRGGSAEDILSLSDSLKVEGFALLAPQASNHSWYPFSFLASPSKNEPWLSSSISVIRDIIKEISAEGISKENIYFLGFSQGACLVLEFVARNAGKYGGVVAFTGGLIGDKIYTENYKGDFDGTPIFIGTGNPDSHVPLQRVQASANILRGMHALVTEKIYDHMGHTINADEILEANRIMFIKSD